jgi:hypothetical protein
MKYALILVVACGLMAVSWARAEDASASKDEVKSLIDQLGAGDYTKREEAAKKLKAIGKPALPALKKAISDADDAEVVSRAQALVKRIEIRPLPDGDPALGNVGQNRITRMRMSVNNGNRVLELTEGGRDIKISDGPDGITMDVTGLIGGERGTEEYTAKDADTLKEENPDAYALYERWAGTQGPGFLFGRGGFNGQVQIGGGFIQQMQAAPDELDQLRTHLEKQMKTAKLKDDQRAEVIKGIDELVETRNDGLGAGMEKYTDQCDTFRKTLAQYKLDPGAFLPPPAKTRLGVSVSTSVAGQLVVQRIAEKSRAERIGLQEGDQILKVDGKEIADIAALRKAVEAKAKGLVVEVNRDGKEVKLEEKEEPAKAIK